jgi:L,D-peptidoglycan transpeptidase YkuD (ErfK/YbiS/YcfS/YnhG family)
MISAPARTGRKATAPDEPSIGRRGAKIIQVRARPGDRRRGLIAFAGTVVPCALGRGGISARKREGDGATPLAAMRAESLLIRRDRVRLRSARLPVRAIRDDDGWCDAPRHGAYNRPVRLPFAASHETLKRADGLYDCCVVLDWNRRPRVMGRGSAIFLHIARPGFAPTEGCIAVTMPVMLRLLRWLDRRTVIRVSG